jgi:uncharacterized protein
VRLAGASLWGAAALVATLGVSGALAATEIPPHTGLVVDQAQVLSAGLESQLEESLRDFQRKHGAQIQFLSVPSLEGEPIEAYSIRVVDSWKLGDEKRDDGALLLIAPKDRQMRIEVGQGLEGAIPDVVAGRIINDVIAPRFKQGQMEAGVVAGLQEMARRAGGELAAPAGMARVGRAHAKGGLGIPLFPLLILVFLVLPGLFRLGRRGRRSSGAGEFIAGMVLGNVLGGRRGGGGNGWGGGGGGGIFGGGGGGGFSGGGSSGRW